MFFAALGLTYVAEKTLELTHKLLDQALEVKRAKQKYGTTERVQVRDYHLDLTLTSEEVEALQRNDMLRAGMSRYRNKHKSGD